MKRWILLLGLALSAALAMSAPPEPPPPAASGATAAALLDTLVLHSRRSATLQSGRLAGPGADLIRELAAPAQFVLFGEAHANSGIADVATALWAELRPLGFRHAAVEVDPWAAAALESELRLGGVAAWNRFLAARGGIIAVPFFSWSPEVRFAEAVLRDGGSLWGLDQVFIGAGAWLLRDLAASASDPQARVQAEALAAEADGKLQWLGQVDVQRLQALRNRLQSPADAAGPFASFWVIVFVLSGNFAITL